MQPTSTTIRVAQRDLTAVSDQVGLPADNGAEAALQAGLELTGHQRIMVACRFHICLIIKLGSLLKNI